jgi:hypothetical protein
MRKKQKAAQHGEEPRFYHALRFAVRPPQSGASDG